VNAGIRQVIKDELNWTGDYVIMPEAAFITEQKPALPLPTSENRTLQNIMDRLDGCTRCGLASKRKNIVFGEGSPDAEIMFIGEGPGAVEDETGRPFVGPAGQLLTDIIVKGMGLKRQDVYIANIVKCRPPGNRNPLPEEAQSCMPFLFEQISVISPKIIITLGAVATQNLLGTDNKISRMRGTLTNYNGIAVMPTFHPSYLLQNPSKKRDTWEDIKKVMEYLGLDITQR